MDPFMDRWVTWTNAIYYYIAKCQPHPVIMQSCDMVQLLYYLSLMEMEHDMVPGTG